MKKLLFFGIIGIVTCFNITFSQNPIRIVTDAPNVQYHPDMDGDYIVYWSNEDLKQHIFLYKISDSTNQEISSNNNTGKGFPKISGNYVVWTETTNDDNDVFFYDINHPDLGVRCLVQIDGEQTVMDIDKGKVLIYSIEGDFPLYTYNLYCYNIPLDTLILIMEDRIESAAISSNYIVYEKNEDIYLRFLTSGETITICDHPETQRKPTISGHTIVWEDNRNGDWDLYEFIMYYWSYTGAHLRDWPLSYFAIERYLPEKSNQTQPHLNGDKLVFHDDRDSGSGIYMITFKPAVYPLTGPVVKIYDSEYSNRNPVVDGNHIVWWDDKNPDPYVTGGSDIYLWERPAGSDLSLSIESDNTSFQTEEYIIFRLYIHNLGPDIATNVFMLDTISQKILIISASSDHGITSIENNVVGFYAESILPDSFALINVIGKAVQTGKASSSASVSGAQPDYIPQNNTCKITVIIKDVKTTQINTEYAGEYSRIKVDKQGFIHIINYKTFPVSLTYITNKTGTWTEEILDQAEGDLFLTNADIDVDNQGHVHICYVISPYSFEYPDKTLYYVNNSSGQWYSTLPLGPSSGNVYTPLIKTDNQNFVHICYNTSFRSAGYLMYINNKSGNWSTPEELMPAYNSIGMDLDANGFVHLTTYSLSTGPTYLTNSPDGQWHMPEILDQNWTGGQLETLSMDIAVDNSGTPHISYVGDYINKEDYKYAIRIDSTWKNLFVDSCGFMGGYNAIAVDSNKCPYIMYVSPNSSELRYAKIEDSSFVNYFVESDMPDFASPSFDVAADPFNNIHYVYNLNDNLYYGTNAPYTIHYGGGDDNSGGYYFANSTPGGTGAPSQPSYNWIDPFGSGHSIITNWTQGNFDNGYFGPVDLPFTFTFFSNYYDQIFINSNGYLSFNAGYTETASNSSIPFFDEPNNILAACAMDLNLDTLEHPESKIFYYGDAHKFIVTYYHSYVNFSNTDYITFQVILYPDGNILYQYNNTESVVPLPSSIGNDALIGIENEIGTRGVCYRNNGVGGPIFSSPLAVMFGPNALILPVIEDKKEIVKNYFLYQNYPNPFNPVTTIKYDIPITSFVTLKIYNILGQEIATLVNEYKHAGRYEINYNASLLPSGVYFYQIKTNEYTNTKKFILLK